MVATDVEFIGAREHVDVTIPRTSIKGRMRLVSRMEALQADAETRRFLASHSFPIDGTGHAALGTPLTYSYEKQVRILAHAIRIPGEEHLALGSVDDYRDLDDDQLDQLGALYNDLQARLDPVGAESISSDEFEEIYELAKQKGRSWPHAIRLREAGPLRDYFGRPACELTDTEVLLWSAMMTGAREQASPRRPSSSERGKNAEFDPSR